MSEELSIPQEVALAVAPVLERHGYELVLCEYVPRESTLRLYIDHPNGVGVDDCARVSHIVGDLLDAEGLSDRIPGRYHLEVSSPGLDRPLVKPRDFQRFVGKRVQITTREPQDGRRRYQGELVQADEREIRVVVDGDPHVIAYDLIAKARLYPDF